MEAFRVIQIPQNGQVTITLPAHLRNQSQLEVIIRPLDDTERKSFDPKEFKGQFQPHLRIEEIATLCQELREEMRSLLLPHYFMIGYS